MRSRTGPAVGVATLYRHFADRHALMRAVVLYALSHTRQEGERALAEESDGFAALTRTCTPSSMLASLP
jgi:AcrR family transcriptional regulator